MTTHYGEQLGPRMGGNKLVTVGNGNDTVSVGEPRAIQAIFHKFCDLPVVRGRPVRSPPMMCLGEEWIIEVYPGGDSSSRAGYVAVYLICLSALKGGYEVKATYCFDRKGANTTYLFGKGKSGWLDMIHRENISRNYEILVHISLCSKPDQFWQPKNKLDIDMLKYLESAEETGDIKFRVRDKDFAAHRSFLWFRVPELADIDNNQSTSPVVIKDVDPESFQALLRFAYANALPNSEAMSIEQAQLLLDVADKWHCTDLKIFAETEISQVKLK